MKEIKITAVTIALGLLLADPAGATKVKLPVETQDCIIWATNGMVKIKRDDVPEKISEKEICIRVAKNEYEPFQLVITPKRDLKEVDVRVSDLVNDEGNVIGKDNIQIFSEYYLTVELPSRQVDLPTPQDWPDPLPPFKRFDLKKETGNQPIWFDVYVPKGTPAGKYSGLIEIRRESTKPTIIPLRVIVYDFELADENHGRSVQWHSIYPKNFSKNISLMESFGDINILDAAWLIEKDGEDWVYSQERVSKSIKQSILNGTKEWRDCRIEARVKIVRAGNFLNGILIRWQDSNNYYLLGLRDYGEVDHIYFTRTNNGKGTTLWADSRLDKGTIGKGQGYAKLKVEARDNKFKIYLNDRMMTEVVDNDPIPAGSAGLHSQNAHVHFTDVRVQCGDTEIFDNFANKLTDIDGNTDGWTIPLHNPEYFEEVAKYKRILLDHRQVPLDIDLPLTSAAAKEYLKDPRVSDFRVPGHLCRTRRDLEVLVEYLKENDLLGKALHYYIGEPVASQYELLRKRGELLRSVEPRLRHLSSAPVIPELIGCINVWAGGDATQGSKRQKFGEESWFYANPDLMLDMPAVRTRSVWWKQVKYNFDGYWGDDSMNYWHHVGDPWEEALWSKLPSHRMNGSCFIYPGGKVGLDDLVPSIRLKVMREAVEDYEYMWLLGNRIDQLKEKFGAKDFVCPGSRRIKELTELVMNRIEGYQKTSQLYADRVEMARLFLKVRDKIAKEIEEVEKSPVILVQTDPGENAVTTYSQAQVSGVVEKGTTVKVNNHEVWVNKTGRFSQDIQLKLGQNRIDIVVKRGRKSKLVRRYIEVAPEEEIFAQLEQAIKDARAAGINTSYYDQILDDIARDTGVYVYNKEMEKAITQAIAELQIEEIEALIRKTQEKIGEADVDTKAILDMAKGYREKGDTLRARNILRALLKQQETGELHSEDCRVTPVIYYGHFGYEMKNSLLHIVVMDVGARIIKFEMDGIPMLDQQAIKTDATDASKHLGGYDDAAEGLLPKLTHSTWNLEVIESTADTVALAGEITYQATTGAVAGGDVVKTSTGYFKIRREMRIWKNNPGLELRYTITNMTAADVASEYGWRAHCNMAIGSDSHFGEGGNPEGDQFVIPTDEPLKFTDGDSMQEPWEYNSQKYPDKVASIVFELKDNYVGAYDPGEKATLMHLLDPKITRVYIWYYTKDKNPYKDLYYTDNIYNMEPTNALGDTVKKFMIPSQGGSVTFVNYLVGYSGVESKEDAIKRIKQYRPGPR